MNENLVVENIKNISFDKFVAVVNRAVENTFQEDVYNADLYDISRRMAMIKGYVPDFEFGEDNNTYCEAVYSREGVDIINSILKTEQGKALNEAIYNAVEHRKHCIENSSMSMSDYALSKLIDVVSKKVEQIDTSVMNGDTIEILKTAAEQTNRYDFAEKVIEGLGNKGYLPKVKNRATRRKKDGKSE